MSDTFVRNPDDNVPIQRLNDEIVLDISRLEANLTCTSISNDWKKAADAPLVRRPDNETADRPSPDRPIYHPSCTQLVDRLPGADPCISFKPCDAPLYRRQDSTEIDKLPERPTRRPNDSPIFTRLTGEPDVARNS